MRTSTAREMPVLDLEWARTQLALFLKRATHSILGSCFLCSALFLLLISAGCDNDASEGPILLPVAGVVTIDGELLTTGGSVSYRDASGKLHITGKVQPDGTYTIRPLRSKKEGAPAGHYKVVVFVNEPMKPGGGLPKLIIDRKYTQPGSTPLKVEVREDAPAGAYDLAVTKPK